MRNTCAPNSHLWAYYVTLYTMLNFMSFCSVFCGVAVHSPATRGSMQVSSAQAVKMAAVHFKPTAESWILIGNLYWKLYTLETSTLVNFIFSPFLECLIRPKPQKQGGPQSTVVCCGKSIPLFLLCLVCSVYYKHSVYYVCNSVYILYLPCQVFQITCFINT